MSSFRNAAPRREHWERGQLNSRSRLGLLEKKKDYLLRAKNYHAKEKRINLLREKARFRNPDEFYFAMQSSKTTKGGLHRMSKQRRGILLGGEEANYTDDMIHLLKTQDATYLKNAIVMERGKIEQLESQHVWLKYENNEKRSNHVIFDDDDDDDDASDESVNAFDELEMQECLLRSPDDLQVENGHKNKVKQEWLARTKRLHQMMMAEKELRLKNHLTGSKGRRRKVGVDKNGLPIYKWSNQRAK